MLQRTGRNTLYGLFSVLQIASLFLIPIVGGLLKLTPSQIEKAGTWTPLLAIILKYIQSEAWWLLVMLGGLAGTSKIVCSRLGAPWVWEIVQSMVGELNRQAFRNNANDPSHHHRVTLFKHVRCRFRVWPWRSRFWPWGPGHWPCSGWLVPVARSGHTTQRTKTIFMAPDEADHAEGVAGKAWSCNGILHKSNLPDLYSDTSKENVAAYANETWLAEELVQKRMQEGLSLARSYLGIQIEVKGKRWGVIVLDSRKPDGILTPKGRGSESYSVMAKFLGRLLERG